MIKIAFIVLLSVSNAVFAQKAATDSEIKRIRASLEDQLLDSESARFKDVKIDRVSEGMRQYCGRVNSKNLYGAYTGFQTFIGIIGRSQDGTWTYYSIGVGPVAEAVCRETFPNWK